MSKASKACDISPKVRQIVYERDNGCCIICGKRPVQIAHFIGRGRLGLGIPENLGCLCLNCHFEYDNGKYPDQIKNAFKTYLKAHYEGWDEKNLIYRKGML